MTRKTGQRNNRPKKAKIKSNIRINLKPFLKNYTNSESRPSLTVKKDNLSNDNTAKTLRYSPLATSSFQNGGTRYLESKACDTNLAN